MQLWAVQDKKTERFYNVEHGYWGLFCVSCLDTNKQYLESMVESNPNNFVLVEFTLERKQEKDELRNSPVVWF
jgi:hypothetical protein